VHSFTANGQFGQMTFAVEGRALLNNPKTSALTAYRMARAVLNRVESMGF